MREVLPDADETLDVLCDGELRIIQKSDGYRFSIDSILLANFLGLKKEEQLLDIGTGCGIIPVYMSKKGHENDMVGVEIQRELFDVAQKNKAINHCPKIRFICGDIKSEAKELTEAPFQVIVSNPPYTKARTGRESPKHGRSVARYESLLTLPELLAIASSLLCRKGRFMLIYPSRRLGELVCAAGRNRLELKRLRLIHPRKEEPSNLFLAEFVKEGGIGATVGKPLYIYENGCYTAEVSEYYSLKD
jgi:tRNA1Val (adenine37-N6)-methyltransferase